MGSTLKVRVLEKKTLIEKIKADQKKRADAPEGAKKQTSTLNAAIRRGGASACFCLTANALSANSRVGLDARSIPLDLKRPGIQESRQRHEVSRSDIS
jgi:hypothetical protein